MGLSTVEAHRKEDNEKRERLAVLHDLFGLPFDRPTQFSAREIVDSSPRFVEFLKSRGNELCALRVMPLDPSLPKLRTRGATIAESMKWFAKQDIDPDKYKADFVPHPSDHTWSTIFVVNLHGAFGQIAPGSHNQLTQGFYDEGVEPITFWWDGDVMESSPKHTDAEQHLLEVLGLLRLKDSATRAMLEEKYDAKFFGEYLCGYFETVASKEFGTWFIDWNRMIGDAYLQVTFPSSPIVPDVGVLRGQPASSGIVTGRARVIRAADIATADLEPGEILVTDMTTPDFLPLMMKAGGVVTAWGGILCHAAIVCRELKKPCVTNVKGALESIHDGAMLEVDATHGTIRILP